MSDATTTTPYDPWSQPLDSGDEKELAAAMAEVLAGPVGGTAESVLVCCNEYGSESRVRGRLNRLMAEAAHGKPVRLRADIHVHSEFMRFHVVFYTEER